MPYLTLTENLKLQLSPGLVASYDIQLGIGVSLFWDKHTHVYLLTYLPRTHTGPNTQQTHSLKTNYWLDLITNLSYDYYYGTTSVSRCQAQRC